MLYCEYKDRVHDPNQPAMREDSEDYEDTPEGNQELRQMLAYGQELAKRLVEHTALEVGGPTSWECHVELMGINYEVSVRERLECPSPIEPGNPPSIDEQIDTAREAMELLIRRGRGVERRVEAFQEIIAHLCELRDTEQRQ